MIRYCKTQDVDIQLFSNYHILQNSRFIVFPHFPCECCKYLSIVIQCCPMYFEFIFPTEITCVPYCFEGRNHIFIYFWLKPSVNLLCSNCAHIYTDDFIDKKFCLWFWLLYARREHFNTQEVNIFINWERCKDFKDKKKIKIGFHTIVKIAVV